jgi:hypothetical protein
MSNQQNQVSLANSLINNAQQTVNNYCSISCNANIGNANIQITGGNAQIKIEQTCTNIGSECNIKNVVNAEIENLINNIIAQKQSNAGFLSLLGPSQNNSTNISNAIKNQVSQLINNTCSQNVDVNLNTLNILSQNANTKITYVQTGTQDHATCSLDTVAKLVLNNQVTNSVKQTQSSSGNVFGILIAMAVIVVLIVIGFVVSKVVGKSGGSGGGGSSGGKGGGGKGNGKDGTPGNGKDGTPGNGKDGGKDGGGKPGNQNVTNQRSNLQGSGPRYYSTSSTKYGPGSVSHSSSTTTFH